MAVKLGDITNAPIVGLPLVNSSSHLEGDGPVSLARLFKIPVVPAPSGRGKRAITYTREIGVGGASGFLSFLRNLHSLPPYRECAVFPRSVTG